MSVEMICTSDKTGINLETKTTSWMSEGWGERAKNGSTSSAGLVMHKRTCISGLMTPQLRERAWLCSRTRNFGKNLPELSFEVYVESYS